MSFQEARSKKATATSKPGKRNVVFMRLVWHRQWDAVVRLLDRGEAGVEDYDYGQVRRFHV